MRIISGSFKGKKILEPKDNNTRPLKDLTKESIFNIIIHSKKFNVDIKNSKILDLFSGVGSFGLECISRGTKKVCFVENYFGVLLEELRVKGFKGVNITFPFKEKVIEHVDKISKNSRNVGSANTLIFKKKL